MGWLWSGCRPNFGRHIHPSGTHVAASPVGHRVRLNAHHAARTRGVDEPSIPQRDADMGCAAAHGFEEYEVTCLYLAEFDRLAPGVLGTYVARQRDAVARKDELSEPAAVEARWVTPAISIGCAQELERGPDHTVPRQCSI